MNNLVSIIVPIYNVADYLVACVDSIISQSYQHLDIILVDDGSTDGSELICDNYLKRDNRIRVIHQENSGLSAARNTGIINIKGEYIVFVDSDDILHPDCILILIKTMYQNNASIVMCDMIRFKTSLPAITISEEQELLTSKEAIRRFLRGEWVSACGKIYKKEVFEQVRFPVGRNNEDYAILTQLFEQCRVVVYLLSPLYYYRVRKGSITKSALNSHSFDEIDNCVEVLAYISNKHPEFYAEAEANLSESLAKLYLELQKTNNPQYAYRLEQILTLYSTHGRSFLKNPFLKIRSRFFIWFHVYIPCLAPFIVKLYILYKK